MGTNDLEEGDAPEAIASNVKLIVSALKKNNADMPIVLCRVFPSHATKKRDADKIQKVNELVEAAVKGDPQVTVVDTWTLFADAEGKSTVAGSVGHMSGRHRIVDGKEAVSFLVRIKECMEDPARLLLEI